MWGSNGRVTRVVEVRRSAARAAWRKIPSSRRAPSEPSTPPAQTADRRYQPRAAAEREERRDARRLSYPAPNTTRAMRQSRARPRTSAGLERDEERRALEPPVPALGGGGAEREELRVRRWIAELLAAIVVAAPSSRPRARPRSRRRPGRPVTRGCVRFRERERHPASSSSGVEGPWERIVVGQGSRGGRIGGQPSWVPAWPREALARRTARARSGPGRGGAKGGERRLTHASNETKRSLGRRRWLGASAPGSAGARPRRALVEVEMDLKEIVATSMRVAAGPG